jgi:hypothetical protein
LALARPLLELALAGSLHTGLALHLAATVIGAPAAVILLAHHLAVREVGSRVVKRRSDGYSPAEERSGDDDAAHDDSGER